MERRLSSRRLGPASFRAPGHGDVKQRLSRGTLRPRRAPTRGAPTPPTQKVTLGGRAWPRRIRSRFDGRGTARSRDRYRMANRDFPVVHQDFLHQRAEHFLALPDPQRPGTSPQPFPETLQRLGDPQVPLPVLGGALDRFQFRLHHPHPTPERRHPPAQLLQFDQFLLVRRHQPGPHSLQPLPLPSQLRHPPPSRIRPASRLQPTLQLGLQ